MPFRVALVTAMLAAHPAASFAQVNLAEAPRPGDLSRYTIELNVTGHLDVLQEGKQQQIKLSARARHRFSEKALVVEDGLAKTSARYFHEAEASALVAGEIAKNELPKDRRLFIASRTADGLLCYSPGGPVTREELDLVAKYFDPQCLPGLLPGKAVAVGDSWPIGNAAVQAACLLDGLTRNSLTGKLTELKGGIASFVATGSAEGLENGAKAALEIQAAGKFDVASRRVIELNWKQSDVREQGAANPASRLEAAMILKREILMAAPSELASVALPPGEPPASLTRLRYLDPRGRFHFEYSRGWHITGQADEYLVLRLLDRGEFIAQATISQWKKAEPGQHAAAEEFQKAANASPGWMPERTLEAGELAIGGGRWLYRMLAEGKSGGQAVVQGFHLLAGPKGNQLAITLSLKPEKLKPLAGRGLALIKAIEFGAK